MANKRVANIYKEIRRGFGGPLWKIVEVDTVDCRVHVQRLVEELKVPVVARATPLAHPPSPTAGGDWVQVVGPFAYETSSGLSLEVFGEADVLHLVVPKHNFDVRCENKSCAACGVALQNGAYYFCLHCPGLKLCRECYREENKSDGHYGTAKKTLKGPSKPSDVTPQFHDPSNHGTNHWLVRAFSKPLTSAVKSSFRNTMFSYLHFHRHRPFLGLRCERAGHLPHHQQPLQGPHLYHWVTFGQTLAKTQAALTGLGKLMAIVNPPASLESSETVSIDSDKLADQLPPRSGVVACCVNNSDLVVWEFICLYLNLMYVPLDSDISPDNMAYILNQTEARLFLATRESLKTYSGVLHDHCQQMGRGVVIVLLDAQWDLAHTLSASDSQCQCGGDGRRTDPGEVEDLARTVQSEVHPHCQLWLMSDIVNEGGGIGEHLADGSLPEISSRNAVNGASSSATTTTSEAMTAMSSGGNVALFHSIRRPVIEPADVLTLIYTSGSSGTPKGAELSDQTLNSWVKKYSEEIVADRGARLQLLFTPLSHLRGRRLVHRSVAIGGQVAMFNGEMADVFSDAAVMHPVIMAAIPRMWHSLYEQFQLLLRDAMATNKLSEDGSQPQTDVIEKKCFRFDPRVYNIWRTFSEILGQRVETVSTGSAATSQACLEWMNVCFYRSDVHNGYGCTEAGQITTNGKLSGNVKAIRLVDVPEMGFHATDQPYPRGEVQVITHAMFTSYFKESGKTSQFLTEDGYFKTGDIARKLPGDRYDLIGRRTFVTKLSQGEFVNLEQVELTLSDCQEVQQLFIYADAKREFVVGIVVPSKPVVEEWWESLDDREREGTKCWRDVCSHPATKRHLIECIHRVGVAANLRGYEIPRNIHVEAEALSAERGFTTPTGKVHRRNIEKHFSHTFAHLYETANVEFLPLPSLGSDELNDIIRDVAPSGKNAKAVDSVSAVRLSNILRHLAGVDIHPESFLNASSADEVKDIVEKSRRASSSASKQSGRNFQQFSQTLRRDLDMELRLPNSLRSALAQVPPTTRSQSSESKVGVFLTGATGFLGCHILGEMSRVWTKPPMASVMNRGWPAVYCLVRGKDKADAEERLLASMNNYGLLKDKKAIDWWRNNVKVVAGDLEKDMFGLEPAEFVELVDRTHAVVHNAAYVNWLHPYESLRNPNVIATVQLLRFAMASRERRGEAIVSGGPVDFHLVSTHGVTPKTQEGGLVMTEKEVWRKAGKYGQGLSSGYGMSKAVCEYLVTRSHTEGLLKCAVYRPGMITCDSRSGAFNATDYISRLILASFVLQTCFKCEPRWGIDMTSVDHVASVIVGSVTAGSLMTLSVDEELHPVHITNPATPQYSAVMEVVREVGGSQMKQVEYHEFRKALLQGISDADPTEWQHVEAISPFIRERGPVTSREDSVSDADAFVARFPQPLIEALTQPTCPPPEAEYLRLYAQSVLTSKTSKTDFGRK